MADPFQHVKPGDSLRLSAAGWNACLDAAKDFQGGRRNQSGSPPQSSPGREGVVLVRNDSGADRGRFEVLGVDGTLYGPDENEPEFQNRPCLKGIMPDADDHTGRFVVLLQPLAEGKIGLALASGVTVVQVDIGDADHAYADVKDGDAASLESGSSGAAAILWKEGGTGLVWAVVKVGLRAAGLSDGTADYQVPVWNNTAKAWEPGWVRAHG